MIATSDSIMEEILPKLYASKLNDFWKSHLHESMYHMTMGQLVVWSLKFDPRK